MPIIALLGLFLVEYYTLDAKVNIIKNASDFSNLATYKDISKEELGRSGNIVFDETNLINAYETFKNYLQKNFNLDADMNPNNTEGLIEGKVNISDFKIYNVINGKVTQYNYNSSSNTFIKIVDGADYTIYTPNGKKVDRTSIYSATDVNMKMIFKYDDINSSKKVTVTSYTDAVN